MKILLTFFASLSISAFVPKAFTTDYEQEFKSQIGKGVRKSKGTFEYQYPGKLKLTQEAPDAMLYVTNTKKTWMYKPPFFDDEKPEVKIHEGQEAGLSNFFDVLKAGLVTNSNYKVKINKNVASLIFKEKAKKLLGIKEAELTFATGKKFEKISDVKIEYHDGRLITLRLKNINISKKFTKNHFDYIPPKNAKIIYQ